MKKLILLILFISSVGFASTLEVINSKLNKQTLQMFVDVFQCDTFIETGTFRGQTTRMGIPLFKEIHTIEISELFYNRAKWKLRKNKHVHCHLGDSAKILPTILEKTQNSKPLIFLDAHWSKGPTGRGETDTPIEAELIAIAKAKPDSMVLLIDDVRDFVGTPKTFEGHGGYPFLWDLVDGVKKHFPDYDFWVVGDMGLFCPNSASIDISPLVKATTTSRLFNAKKDSPIGIVQKEKAFVKHAKSEEADHILTLQVKFRSRDFPVRSVYFNLWSGLVHMGRSDLEKALRCFNTAINNGFPDWRARFYRAKAAKLLGKKEIAAKDLAAIAKKYPQIDFQKLFKEL